jgi:DNA polymerase-3 subunit alpha
MLNAYTENEDGEKTYTELENGQQVTMGGMIGAFKKLKTRSGAFMAFVTVEDLYGSIECVCFPKIYERIRNFLESDRVVSVSGKISIEEEKAPVIIVDKMTEFDIEEIESRPQVQTMPAVREVSYELKAQPITSAPVQKKAQQLWLNVTPLDEEDVDELLEVLSAYAGDTVVWFVKDGKKMLCSEKVNVNKVLMAELATFLPETCIKLI